MFKTGILIVTTGLDIFVATAFLCGSTVKFLRGPRGGSILALLAGSAFTDLVLNSSVLVLSSPRKSMPMAVENGRIYYIVGIKSGTY